MRDRPEMFSSLFLLKAALLQLPSYVGPVVALIVAIAIAGIAIIVVSIRRN